MADRRREYWIDTCKGLAIIFVVMGHVVTSFHNSSLLKDAVAFNYFGNLIYSFHMPLFFMISGLLFNMSNVRNTGQAIKKRVISYGIPYVVFSVLIVVSKSVFSSIVNSSFSWKDLVGIVLYPLTFFWFLYALLIISVVQIIIGRFERRHNQKIIITLVLVCGLVVKVATEYLPTQITAVDIKNLGLMDACKYYIWFVIGQYVLPLMIWQIKIITAKKMFLPAVIIVTILYGIIVGFLQYYQIDYLAISIVMSFGGSVIVISFSIFIDSNRLFVFVGKYTMPIYLFHGFVISAVRICLVKLHIPLLGGSIPMIVCIVLGTAIPLGGYLLLGRIKPFDFCIYPTKYISIRSKQDT
ncbi:MAG: acyltransferase [Ruminococcus sp.]|nr:acyltransferase [Ruminococcus sp.]